MIAGPMATGIAEVGVALRWMSISPEVMMSAKGMHGLEVLKPLIVARRQKTWARLLQAGSGDLHDIGKKIVAMMMEAAGFTVIIVLR